MINMTEYGLIDENGIMTSKMLEPYNECYQDSEGELIERAVSIEEQAETLKASGWKPVDLIDESKMVVDENYTISLVPYDNGERISYRYEKNFDRKSVLAKIQSLKNELSADDYKIIKSYEATLIGENLPYNVGELSMKRRVIREEINRLELLITR